MKKLIVAMFTLISVSSFSQIILNEYAAVTLIDNQCVSTVSVESTTGFSVGDEVLIIQMKGASVNLSSSDISEPSSPNNYGSITNIGNAGNFEFATINLINGLDIQLSTLLGNGYDVTGIVQLVKVYTASSYIVNNTISSSPWNFNNGTGGVVVMNISGTLTLNANIDVSGEGFEGGSMNGSDTDVNGDSGCSSSTMDNSFGLNIGADKGEGIVSFVSGITNTGAGSLANGGGGGNGINLGGGGGSNANWGGISSDAQWISGPLSPPNSTMCTDPVGTQSAGGIDLSSYLSGSKIFLGGGGGSGNSNGLGNSSGGNGGGIVIIQANNVVSNGNSIISNGISAANLSMLTFDGAGGGGAAGSIILDIANSNAPVDVVLEGGNGGTTIFTNPLNNNCLS